MASFIHECESCGTPLTVHERYFGRILRCTVCGAHFEATPPPEAVEEAAGSGATGSGAAGLSIDGPKKRRGRRVPVAIVVSVLTMLAVGWWLSTDPLPQPLVPGTLASVAGSDPAPAALDSAGADALALFVAGDGPAVDGPTAVRLGPGTRVQLLERPDRDGVVAVRVLDGSWASRKVWVPARRLATTPDQVDTP